MYQVRDRVCFVAVVLALLQLSFVQAAPPREGENILRDFNPGFEQTGRGAAIPGWTVAYGKCEIVGDAAVGKKSLHCVNNCKLYSNKLIRVEPGYRYFMSAHGKIRNFKFIKEGIYGVGFGLEQLNAQKQIQGDWYYMYNYLKYAEGDKGWEYTCGDRVRPKETTIYIRPALFVWAVPGSEAWFDEVHVWREKIPEQKVEASLNIIENGSFEVRYDMERRPFGFNIPEAFAKNAVCVTDEKHGGAASIRITGECTISSNAGALEGKTAEARIAVKTHSVAGGKAFARLTFYDKDRHRIKTQDVIQLDGTREWQIYAATLKDLDPATRSVAWEFGMPKGATGTTWFDDAQVNAPATLQAFPHRGKNTSHVNVTVDCAARKGEFVSPLNAFDHHNVDRVYSPTIGTAGPFVEGPGHWYRERVNLGFKYVRIHHIYQSNVCTVRKGPDGKAQVDFALARTHYPESGQEFGSIVKFDKSGQMKTDFSVIRHILDKALLAGGCKPIIGLEPVPGNMARGGDTHNGPVNYKDWEELNYRFVKFLVDTYGKDEVRTWIFETGNEPGTEPEWHGFRTDPKDTFIRMQDYTVAGAVRAFPEVFIAGPSGGVDGMDALLDHCATGINEATGKIGTKIDAISYHGYLGGYGGDISWRQAEDQILNSQARIRRFETVTGKRLLLFNTEFTPIYFDGGRDPKNPPHEQNNHIQAIATLHTGFFSQRLGVSLITFFFQSPIYFGYSDDPAHTPEFQGLPTCITFHGIFNPVCRAYQIMSRLNGGTQVAAEADSDPVYALATVTDRQIRVLCYSFDSNPQVKYVTTVDLAIHPTGPGDKFKVTKYELSATKANSWFLAQQMKLTQADCVKTPSVVDRINRESELKPEDAGAAKTEAGTIHLRFALPAYSAALYVLDRK